MTTTQASKSATVFFPTAIDPSELEAIALSIDTHIEEIELNRELELEYRAAHSKAIQLLNAKLDKARDLAKVIKSNFATKQTDESGIDRINRVLSRMINETAFVEADYLSLTGAEIEELLPPANRNLFQSAIYSYVPEMGVNELKKIIKKIEDEIKQGFFVVEHQKAFLVAACSRGIAAWYTSSGILIAQIEATKEMQGQVMSDSGAAILEAL